MSGYIDMVICKDASSGIHLAQAPAWSGLKEGDEVVIQTEYDDERAEILSICTVEVESDTFKFISAVAFQSDISLTLKRVVSRVTYSKFEYEEDKENGSDKD